jgi:hypothetical protein
MLSDAKVKYKDGGILLSFELDAGEPKNQGILSHMAALQIAPTVRIAYTQTELLHADYIRIISMDSYGYPEPQSEDSQGLSYREHSFDVSKMCRTCGIFRDQIAPIMVRRRNYRPRSALFGIYWLNDIIMTESHIAQKLESELTGIKTKEVIDFSKGTVIDGLSQIEINTLFPSRLHFETNLVQVCPTCGKEKFVLAEDAILRFDPLKSPSSDFYYSAEYFGYGGFCDRLIIVSRRAYILLSSLSKSKIRAEPLLPISVQ